MRFRSLSVGNLVVAFFLCNFGSAAAQQALDAARKEGQVVFYASMEAQSAQRLSAAFEKKYPLIKVDTVRIGSEKMATRLFAEAQARRISVDVVHQSAFGAVQAMLIYGSKARGQAHAESDLDVLLIVKNDAAGLKRELRWIGYLLAAKTDVLPSILAYTEEEWESRRRSGSTFRKAVERDAVRVV